jgi:hypothetical protein
MLVGQSHPKELHSLTLTSEPGGDPSRTGWVRRTFLVFWQRLALDCATTGDLWPGATDLTSGNAVKFPSPLDGPEERLPPY